MKLPRLNARLFDKVSPQRAIGPPAANSDAIVPSGLAECAAAVAKVGSDCWKAAPGLLSSMLPIPMPLFGSVAPTVVNKIVGFDYCRDCDQTVKRAIAMCKDYNEPTIPLVFDAITDEML